ncbi:MAG: hypothetical protein OXI30_21400 [Chloroflexota bacterium]|nr:hypothetical protein [Chloroflexota bacterium]
MTQTGTWEISQVQSGNEGEDRAGNPSWREIGGAIQCEYQIKDSLLYRWQDEFLEGAKEAFTYGQPAFSVPFVIFLLYVLSFIFYRIAYYAIE